MEDGRAPPACTRPSYALALELLLSWDLLARKVLLSQLDHAANHLPADLAAHSAADAATLPRGHVGPATRTDVVGEAELFGDLPLVAIEGILVVTLGRDQAAPFARIGIPSSLAISYLN